MSVSRFLSLVVFCIYIFVALFLYPEASNVDFLSYRHSAFLFPFVMFFLFCLTFIWFPDQWGSIVRGRVTRPSPGGLVAFMGWVLLLLPPLVLILVKIIYKYVL